MEVPHRWMESWNNPPSEGVASWSGSCDKKKPSIQPLPRTFSWCIAFYIS